MKPWFFQASSFQLLKLKFNCDDHSSLSSTTIVQWIISHILHITSLQCVAPNVWLHSLVGRASHRNRGGHGFKSRWSPDFFRLLLSNFNCDRWSLFTFINNRSSNMNYFIYTSHKFISVKPGQVSRWVICGIDERVLWPPLSVQYFWWYLSNLLKLIISAVAKFCRSQF